MSVHANTASQLARVAKVRPNPSLEPTRSGVALGPRGRFHLSSASRAKRHTCARGSAQTLGLTGDLVPALRRASMEAPRSQLLGSHQLNAQIVRALVSQKRPEHSVVTYFPAVKAATCPRFTQVLPVDHLPMGHSSLERSPWSVFRLRYAATRPTIGVRSGCSLASLTASAKCYRHLLPEGRVPELSKACRGFWWLGSRGLAACRCSEVFGLRARSPSN